MVATSYKCERVLGHGVLCSLSLEDAMVIRFEKPKWNEIYGTKKEGCENL